MKSKFYKKSQITIFLIISLIVIFLLVYLISSSVSKKNEVLKSAKNQLSTDSKLVLLKDNVDFCMNKELKKSLIIAGFRGGFIYDNGEFYTSSVNLPSDYNPNLISNLNLNWNNLHDRVLIHYQSDVFTPRLNKSYLLDFGTAIPKKIIYNNSIKKEMEKYILSGFLNCINLDKYKNQGYTIIKEQNIGKILHINGTTLDVLNISGKIGDKIEIIFLGNTYYGNISGINSNISKISLDSNLPSGANVNLNNIIVKNLNSSIFVNLIFNSENVIAKLNFPITIKKGDFSTSYTTGIVTVNVRFKEYLKISNLLLNAKKENRSLDYSSSADLSRILNSLPYFKNTNLHNLNVYKTIINNSAEHKVYIYSIYDKDSKIYGSPFIFNFGYVNDAPKIDLSRLGSSFFDNNSILFQASVNFSYNMNLANLVTDKQYFDKYKFYFKPESVSIPNYYSYSLNKLGYLSFIAYVRNTFSFNIELTDGEASRTQHFTFVTGFPDNTKNKKAKDCLIFNNYPDSNGAFPINYEYINKIFNYTDSNGVSNLYAYQLYAPLVGIPNLIHSSRLKIKNICMGLNPTAYHLIGNYSKLDGTYVGNLFGGVNYVNLPSAKTYNYIVSLGIENKITHSLVAKPFKITIYTSKCLGPSQVNSSRQAIIGGKGSCCNLAPIKTDRTQATSTPIGVISNILSSGSAVNADAYFTFFIGNPIFPGTFDYSSKIIWNPSNYGVDATSIYEGKIKSTCNGVYPRFENNIESISSSASTLNSKITDFFSNDKIYHLPTNPVDKRIPISLKVVKSAKKCEFSNLKKYVGAYYLKLSSGSVMKIGFKGDNPNLVNYLTPIPSSIPNPPFVKCDNNFYATNISSNPIFSNWTKNQIFGKGGHYSVVINSSGFCQVGAVKCAGRINSLGSDKESDIVNSCTDYFVNPFGKILSQVGHFNEVCGSYTSYSCGCTGVVTGGDKIVINTLNEVTCVNAITQACPILLTNPIPVCTGVCP